MLINTFEQKDLDLFEKQGFVILENVITPELANRIKDSMRSQEQSWREAGVGRHGQHLKNTLIRGDHHVWLGSLNPALDGEEEVAGIFETIKSQLMESFPSLGLQDWEAQFAVYPPGKGYSRHLDAFADGKNRRKISVVLYLNEGWNEADGGAIKLYPEKSNEISVYPELGRAVVFVSEELEHEVCPPQKERWSISGWIRS